LRNLAVSADSFKELHSHLEEGNKVSGCCS